MPDQLVLDIIDRPHGGALAAMRRVRALRRGGVPGLRGVVPLGTGRFVERVRPAPTPRRLGLLTAWDEGADVEATWERLLGPLAGGAGEHWHVRGELTRASWTAAWRGWVPDAAGARPLADDEPALVLISGELRARFLPVFARDAAGAIAQANREAGYLGGLAVQSSPLNTTSCSAWRTYADARRYAYAAGRHAQAMRRDRAGEHHRTERFLRIRPLVERGTLDGRAPFAGLLGAATPGPAAAAQPVGVTR